MTRRRGCPSSWSPRESKTENVIAAKKALLVNGPAFEGEGVAQEDTDKMF